MARVNLFRYRGASPIQYTIMNGDSETGVSLIDLDSKEFDAGNIWLQERIAIEPYQSFRSLEERLALLSADLLASVISDFERFRQNKAAQSGAVSYAPKIQKKDARISLGTMTLLEIYGRYQALNHQEKIHTQLLDGREVQFLEILDPRETEITGMSKDQFSELDRSSSLGSTFFERPTKIVWIKCHQGWLPVTNFRLQGKSLEFPAANFQNAARLINFKPAFKAD